MRNRLAKGMKWIAGGSLCLILLFLGISLASDKKLEITAEQADVYLKPDASSTKIGSLEKGDLVTLASSTKIKKIWYYVYFCSKDSGYTSSGYILDSSVKKLFSVTKVFLIQEGKTQKNSYNYGVNFRNTRWGMSRQQVIFTEGEPLSSEKSDLSSVLQYQSSLLDLDCLLMYLFSENSLVGAKYLFPKKYSANTDQIDDHRLIKNALIEKYGEPKHMDTFPGAAEGNHSADKTLHSQAQNLLKTTCWETQETRVCLNLYQNEEHVEMELKFADIDSHKLRIKASQKSPPNY